jgi:hypothetical protein
MADTDQLEAVVAAPSDVVTQVQPVETEFEKRDRELAEAEHKFVDVVENAAEIRIAVGFKTGGKSTGRPRTGLISRAYRRMLQKFDPDDPEGKTYAEGIAMAMIKAAMRGDVAAAKEIREVTEGKVPQRVEVEFSGGVTVDHILSEATDAELDAIIGTYVAEAKLLPDGEQGPDVIDGEYVDVR